MYIIASQINMFFSGKGGGGKLVFLKFTYQHKQHGSNYDM